MAVLDPSMGSGWLDEINEYAKSQYGPAVTHAMDVLRVYRGEFGTGKDLDDTDIEIVRPSTAYNIVQKMMSMLAIRSHKGITVIQDGNSDKEAQAADRLERALRAYIDTHTRQSQRDPLRDSAYYAVMRGRAGLHVVYDPLKRGLRVRIRALDPFTYFPVHSDEGVEFFTMEYTRSRLELQAFFDNLEKKRGDETSMRTPQLIEYASDNAPSLIDRVTVKEYWDEEWHAYSIGDEYFWHRHGYGFVPLVEFRFNETPEDEQRWAYGSLLSGVLEDLKLEGRLLSKMATGTEQFYFPRMYYVSTDGSIQMVDHHTAPGDWTRVKEGTQPIILNPSANAEALEGLLTYVSKNIGEGTLNPIVFQQDVPDVSGFLVSQFLTLVQDSIADKRYPMERGFGVALGQVLQLFEKFADKQPDKGWRLPITSEGMKRPSSELLTAAEIGGRHDVRVSIQVALPQDKVSMLTQFNQSQAPSPVTGLPFLDWESGMKLSGLEDLLVDTSEVRKRRELEYAIANDEEVNALYLAHIKAENDKLFHEWRKKAEKAVDREEARIEKAAEEAALEDGEKPLVIPPELKDPQFLSQLAQAIASGQDGNAFIRQVQEGDLNFMPGEDPMAMGGGGTDPAILQQLMEQMRIPAGMTGFEGLDPRALPSAAAGGLNRRTMDRDNLLIEETEDERLPGLPPRR